MMKMQHNKLAISILLSLFLLLSSVNMALASPISDRKIERISTDPKQGFSQTISGKTYQMEYMTEEDIENTKIILNNMDLNEENELIDGFGTGLTAPTDKELEILKNKPLIKNYIPKSVDKAPGAAHDFSSQIYFPEVRSQQSQGSCGAWASTYYAYGYMEAKDNGWDASSGNNNNLMNPAWTFNKVSITNGGSWMTTNSEIIKNFGCATYATMPYVDTDYWNWGNETAWREAPNHRLDDYYLMDFNEGDPTSTIDAIKSFISSDTPVTFAFNASSYSAGFADANYILSSDEYDHISLNHAQCIVGYDDSITDDGEVGAFKVVNSWGTSFGDSGFYWLTYECLIEIGLNLGDFGVHLCVITDKIDYEPDLVATWEFSTAPERMEDMITFSVGPYDSPLETITPWYEFDNVFDLPDFMTFDISDFYSYYVSNNDEIFYIDIGSSPTTGSISSLLIERYSSGVLVETTAESIHVPATTPGYAMNTFMTIDHETEVRLETPDYPKIGESYLINATVENYGAYTETNVDLEIHLDKKVVDSTTIASLPVGSSSTISYLWTPLAYGTYNFTAYSKPVIGDGLSSNNQKQRFVSVDKWENYVMTVDNPYAWIDASGGTELVLEDDDYAHVTLPFDFSFYNHSFSKVYLSSNGYLSFYDETPDEYENDPFPSGLAMHSYMIAPFWEDIYPQFNGHIYVQSFSGYWVAQWQDVPYTYPSLENCTFQVILYESGDIVFNYDYFQASFTSTCGLNLGLDDTYYNSYDGLTAATNNFSIKFNSTSLLPSQPGSFTLTTDADLPDTDGSFYLNWTNSLDVTNYSVYSHTGMITEINSSITWMVNETTNNYVHTSGYSDGTYFFVVVAANDHGERWSNIISVYVDVPGNNIPGYNIIVLLISVIGITVMLLKSTKTMHRK